MSTFTRVFGSGPIGLLISIVLLLLAFHLQKIFNVPQIIFNHNFIPILIFTLFTIISIIIIIWSLVSLNPKLRGKTLITTGALKYFRHPLYAAFLTFFNFGLAFFLNNWIFIIWALLLHPIWHFLVIKEENDLKNSFPDEYDKYCNDTGRFFPRFFRKSR
jgi:protein-S-isoprenylcysteine O-methyltransferase Ste14